MAHAGGIAPQDLTRPHNLTAGLIERLTCPAGKDQAFLRDTKAPGLRVRVTKSGAKSFVFESKLGGDTLRYTIGGVKAWPIEEARAEANRLRVLVDSGQDPRELAKQDQVRRAERAAAERTRQAQESAKAITVSEAWQRYMVEGRPKRKAAWKPRYRADLLKAADLGGTPRRRGEGLTKPGHLASLMPRRLVDITVDLMREWLVHESKRSARQAARCAAMFSGFLRWCSLQRDYRELVDAAAASSAALGDLLPAQSPRKDAIELDQLKPWFAATEQLESASARVCLQALILTGARREEITGLLWANVDLRWRKLTLDDKVDQRWLRTIPLSPYLAAQLSSLERVRLDDGRLSPYVFAVPTNKSGHLAEPRSPHRRVLERAQIQHVSIHGLRRTFSLTAEAAGAPSGAIAQVMGHKPSAVAEGYRPRSLDALRPYLEQIERYFLQRAGIKFRAAK